MGVILYVLVSGSLPFDSENLQYLKQRVLCCKYRIPYFMSQDCEDLLSHLLVVNPSKRYKLQQIKSHKWIKINSSSYYYLFNQSDVDGADSSNIEEINCQQQKTKDKFKSKSLKIVSNRRHSTFIDTSKNNSALSSLSLPLYSYEDYMSQKKQQNHHQQQQQGSQSRRQQLNADGSRKSNEIGALPINASETLKNSTINSMMHSMSLSECLQKVFTFIYLFFYFSFVQ
jgi:serine/threonine protein kinase